MKVVVDTTLCTGHGRCYALAPDVFGADDFGHCEILVTEPLTEVQRAQAKLGADNCPERAIAVHD